MKYPIRFGKYLLLERVNVGGMAEVFKAKAFGVEGFQRILAIKRILPNMSEDAEFINMFVDEARLAVQLNHANIVQIYELGKQDEQYYIAMEYVAGKDLRRIVEFFRKSKQVLPVPLAAYICAKICEGLDYAHRKLDPMGQPINLVHRDVSPQNILVSFEGDVKVIDFGIAKAADRLSKTQAGVLKGKFGYMSPEQVSGEVIDRRSDVFAVGVLLYEMLTCTRLFVAESDFSTLEKVRQCSIPAMREFNAEIPEELEAVVGKALAKDREVRYQWCSDLNEDLQRFLITDQSIFNSKRMSGFMKETFQEDIEGEMSRMQEYMRIGPDDVAESDGSDQASGAPGGESTQIFEVGDSSLANAETRVGSLEALEASQSGPVAKENGTAKAADLKRRSGTQRIESTDPGLRRQTASGEVANKANRTSQSKVKPVARSSQELRGAEEQQEEPKEESDHTLLVFGGACLLAALILGVAIWWTQFRRVDDAAWLVINSDPPIVQAELYLDGKLSAKQVTPFDKIRIAAGHHDLRFLAKDYVEIVRPVDLQAGKMTAVTLKLVPALPPVPPPAATQPASQSASQATTQPVTPPMPVSQPIAKVGSLSVDSEPHGAIIYLDGKKVGVTPAKIDGLPIGKIAKLELKKNGFRTLMEDFEIHGDESAELKLQPHEKSEKTEKVEKVDKPDKVDKPKQDKKNEAAAKGMAGLVVNIPGWPDTKVIVDGHDTKRVTPVLPNNPIHLAAGRHAVQLIFKDATKKAFQIDFNAGETYKLIEVK